MLQRRLRPVAISRFRATSSIARSTSRKRGAAEARPLPRLDQVHRRSGRHRAACRHPGECGTAGDPVRPAGLGLPRPRGGRSRCCAGSTFPATSTAPPRLPAARRSAPLRSHALARLRQGRRGRDHRHAVRLPHGLRQAHQRADAGADRSRLPHRRQEPRHRPRHRRRSGRDVPRRAAGGGRPARRTTSARRDRSG